MKKCITAVKKMSMVLVAALLLFASIPVAQAYTLEYDNNPVEIRPFDEFPEHGGGGGGHP